MIITDDLVSRSPNASVFEVICLLAVHDKARIVVGTAITRKPIGLDDHRGLTPPVSTTRFAEESFTLMPHQGWRSAPV